MADYSKIFLVLVVFTVGTCGATGALDALLLPLDRALGFRVGDALLPAAVLGLVCVLIYRDRNRSYV